MLFFPCVGKLKIHFGAPKKPRERRLPPPFPSHGTPGAAAGDKRRKDIPVQSTIQTHTQFALSNRKES